MRREVEDGSTEARRYQRSLARSVDATMDGESWRSGYEPASCRSDRVTGSPPPRRPTLYSIPRRTRRHSRLVLLAQAEWRVPCRNVGGRSCVRCADHSAPATHRFHCVRLHPSRLSRTSSVRCFRRTSCRLPHYALLDLLRSLPRSSPSPAKPAGYATCRCDHCARLPALRHRWSCRPSSRSETVPARPGRRKCRSRPRWPGTRWVG